MALTVGTAGHIDHGKTWLVRALTGKDTDRLPEEQERGISIALGYAPLELPDGTRLSLIDVPGHERFVRTMVAGATGIDLFLLVIDAGEGARLQTHEHLAILRLLRIERGVVAVTKADAVDAETLELAVDEARELVPGAEVVAVSAKTGAGLDELREALARAAAGVPARRPDAPARLYCRSAPSRSPAPAPSSPARSGRARSRPATSCASSRPACAPARAASRCTTCR
jgi:selenocysteine-specific elongation factor